MAQPFVGEIRMVGFNFAPVGWFVCQGQLLAISEYDVLFNLIGTTYGGDGENTFALPDLQGRFPVHQGNGTIMGQLEGTENVTIITQQLPVHTHAAIGSAAGNLAAPTNAFWSTDPGGNTAAYNPAGGSSMAGGALALTGGDQPHNNLQPYLALNFIIATFGIFPSQS